MDQFRASGKREWSIRKEQFTTTALLAVQPRFYCAIKAPN